VFFCFSIHSVHLFARRNKKGFAFASFFGLAQNRLMQTFRPCQPLNPFIYDILRLAGKLLRLHTGFIPSSLRALLLACSLLFDSSAAAAAILPVSSEKAFFQKGNQTAAPAASNKMKILRNHRFGYSD